MRANAADAELAAEVSALLHAHDTTGRFDALLDRIAGLGAEQHEGQDRDPERIGPYRVLRRIGRGGMGAVYLAERDDGQFEHRVAIKVLRADRAGPELRRRFLTERRILAQLTHENIAWLLDGNVTEDGSPYLVMEYVDGRPIIEWCDQRHRTIAERLALFLEVCSAVEYAHRRLVVHRDLKPGNILVTDAGAVKLLDFGIAKLLEPEPELALPATRTGLRLMTPEYASPEQVRGDTVGTPSDVYQLGVLLYELLTGRRPYATDGSSLAQIEAAIVSTDPVRPSAALTSLPDPGAIAEVRGTTRSRLNRRLAGDLDHIILKSLRKEPEQRYGSVTALAEDVRRHLEGRPVLARRGTVRYRAARFVRRHRVGVCAAGLVALSLVAGILSTSWQAARASEQARVAAAERDRAQLEAEKAAQITAFVIDLFNVSDPRQALGRQRTAREILEAGAQRLDTELADQPQVRATMMDVIGLVYRNLGEYDRAWALHDAAFGLRRDAPSADQADVAENLNRLGAVAVGQARYDTALVLLRQSLLLRTAQPDPDSADIASNLNDLASLFINTGSLDSASAYFEEAIAMRRSLGADEASSLAVNLANFAAVKSRQGDHDGAEALAREGVEILRRTRPAQHPEIALALNNLGVLLLRKGDNSAAEPVLREALDIRRAVLGPEHPELAMTTVNLATALERLQDLDGAEQLQREALNIKRAQFESDHPSTAISLNNLGLVLAKKGDYAEAERLLRESLAMRRRIFGDDHADVARAYHNLGKTLFDAGESQRAQPPLRAALQIRQRRMPRGSAETAQTAFALARVLVVLKSQREAQALLEGIVTEGEAAEQVRALLDSLRSSRNVNH